MNRCAEMDICHFSWTFQCKISDFPSPVDKNEFSLENDTHRAKKTVILLTFAENMVKDVNCSSFYTLADEFQTFDISLIGWTPLNAGPIYFYCKHSSKTGLKITFLVYQILTAYDFSKGQCYCNQKIKRKQGVNFYVRKLSAFENLPLKNTFSATPVADW